MTVYDRKYWFWLLLFASAGGSLLTGYIVALKQIGYSREPRGREFSAIPILFLVNLVFAATSIRGLRRVYAEEPPNWTGRWQLSLSDLLFITIVIGLVMAAFSAIQSDAPDYRTHFLYEGVPLAMGVGLCFAISILIVSRTGSSSGTGERWLASLLWLVGAGVATVWSLIVEMVILGLIIGP